jgi:hypothetical protein
MAAALFQKVSACEARQRARRLGGDARSRLIQAPDDEARYAVKAMVEAAATREAFDAAVN